MKITNKTVGWFMVFGIPLGCILIIGLTVGFLPEETSIGFVLTCSYITLGFELLVFIVCLIIALITGDIEFEFEIKNPFKKGRYLTEEEEKHFKEYLKDREK